MCCDLCRTQPRSTHSRAALTPRTCRASRSLYRPSHMPLCTSVCNAPCIPRPLVSPHSCPARPRRPPRTSAPPATRPCPPWCAACPACRWTRWRRVGSGRGTVPYIVYHVRTYHNQQGALYKSIVSLVSQHVIAEAVAALLLGPRLETQGRHRKFVQGRTSWVCASVTCCPPMPCRHHHALPRRRVLPRGALRRHGHGHRHHGRRWRRVRRGALAGARGGGGGQAGAHRGRRAVAAAAGRGAGGGHGAGYGGGGGRDVKGLVAVAGLGWGQGVTLIRC